MKPRRSIAILAVSAVVACGLLTSCSKKEEEGGPEVTVQAAKVEKRPIRQIIGTEAVLYPKNQAAITPKIVAPVKEFYVNRGSRVHAGQLLAVIENRDLAAAATETKGSYNQAEAAYQIETTSALPEEWQKAEYDLKAAKENLDAAQKIYDSRKKLYDEGALPRKDYDASIVALTQAKSQYEIASMHMAALQSAGKKQQLKSAEGQLTSAKGKYEGAAAQLGYSEIRSPINGVVTDRPTYPGETPPPGVPMLTVMDTSSVIAKAHIPQDQAAQLKPGNTATMKGPGDVEAEGKVTLVSPALDPNSTTVEVWVEAANADRRLRPGSSVTLEMVAQSVNDAIVVPASAILKSPEGATTVMVIENDKAEQKEVETGIREGNSVQITKGLTGNETVIVNGSYALPDKTRVKIAQATPAEEPAAEKPSGDKDKD
ncbi:MAG TPA: efflux RND transporter periplasmic adaptor subunit [Candidatus Binatia bacterium]|nr:efflux RND transporter periplasmic adaptor subunit [Candidatus Binatia bacterium]